MAVPPPSPSTPLAPVIQAQGLPAGSATADKGLDLLQQARRAMDAAQYQDAVDVLNAALMLPPNPYSPPAQELVGMAWEALNNPARAKIEDQLYLRLYPQGEAVERVTDRLARLNGQNTAAASAPGAPAAALGKDGTRTSIRGGVSQYYYGGNTKTDSLVNIAQGIDQATLNETTQSVLVSSWDASASYLTPESETKLVMRGSHSDSLSASSTTSTTTQGLVSAAYVDYRDLKTRLEMRVGRQSAIGGSMFGLFDGVSAAVPVGDSLKADAMLGVPANTLVNAPQQQLAGVMLEADNLPGNLGGSVSLLDQTSEGIDDRRALGVEMRYFGDIVSLNSQLTYELNFNALDAFTVQGSTQGPYDTTVTLLLDDRKAPALQLSDALISSGATSLSTLLQLNTLSQVQSMALDTAAEARQAMISVSRSLSTHWQGSMDLRYSDVGALPAVGNFQAQPATGAQYDVSLQLTGSNLYSQRDINGFNVSYITSDTINGIQLGYNNLTGIWDNVGSLEPSIRYYTQTDNTDTRVTRVSPGVRLTYKLNPRANLIGETLYENSLTDGPTNHESGTSMFFYFGYHYDFR